MESNQAVLCFLYNETRQTKNLFQIDGGHWKFENFAYFCRLFLPILIISPWKSLLFLRFTRFFSKYWNTGIWLAGFCFHPFSFLPMKNTTKKHLKKQQLKKQQQQYQRCTFKTYNFSRKNFKFRNNSVA